MNVKPFRADSMHEALQLVRRHLGPDAAVLRTREVRGGVVQWLLGKRRSKRQAIVTFQPTLSRPAGGTYQSAARLSIA